MMIRSTVSSDCKYFAFRYSNSLVRPLATSLSTATAAAYAEADNTNHDGSTSLRREKSLGRKRPIFVAATRQHVGKTTSSLALMSGLQKRFGKVGFMKPVGQVTVSVLNDHGSEYIQVDKDAALIKTHFRLDHESYRDSSPIIIPSGYTKDFLDGKITSDQQNEMLMQSFSRIAASSDIVLCEGTGHCAVGSIVQACNAQVASWLDAKMVLVANGGLGNTFDELELNKTLCDRFGVEIAGIIINKVQPDKLDQTKYYLERALDRWEVPILACIPDRPFLGSPNLADLERLFPGATLVSGQAHRLRHYRAYDLHLVATSLNLFLKNIRKNPPRSLYVCHSSRNDILLGFLMESHLRKSDEWMAGMIVTGCDDYPISSQVMEIVMSMPPSAPPVLVTPLPTREVMERIYALTPKLNLEDGHRIAIAVDHYEPAINFDLLLERMGYVNGVATSDL